ncbi:hypothetical protein G7K_2761-t1 [Saitoella complicata NRRL Y-17804]|uniref:Uncharacterized protein n=1 Tax=Saitoella complicata (strain BCRC 22490 / CBS 7301 / JCM 7358 / NBRC 10748 / NRRL Y-17804) TaxID=698492 RepID=A0A0E9NFJ6_SAICN|nr:hypothetical protein G7K_2761-t1 [Saitoella complicata NRRL Y-17804]
MSHKNDRTPSFPDALFLAKDLTTQANVYAKNINPASACTNHYFTRPACTRGGVTVGDVLRAIAEFLNSRKERVSLGAYTWTSLWVKNKPSKHLPSIHSF